MTKMRLVALLIASVSGALAAQMRGAKQAKSFLQQQSPVVGFPEGGVPIEPVPILPEHLDFAAGVQDSDFVFDVHPFLTSRPPNQGEGGTVSGRDSANTKALQGQGIALSLFTLRPGGQNLIHYHPRATELLFVFRGQIEVGFTDTTGALHMNNVRAGQATIFPRGMLHFQRNIGEEQAEYISILNDEIPGVMSFPRVLLGLPTHIIAQAFRTDIATIEQLKQELLPPGLTQGGTNPNYDGAAGPLGNAPVPGPPGNFTTNGNWTYESANEPLQGSNDTYNDPQALFEKLLEAIKAQQGK